MKQFFDYFCTISGIAAAVWLIYLGMKNDPSMKPTIRRTSRLEKEMRDSAAHGKWV
jgi:hypothetical protein